MVNKQMLIAQRDRAEHDARALLEGAAGRALTPEEAAQHDALVDKIRGFSEHLERLAGAAPIVDALARYTGGAEGDGRGRIVLARAREVKSAGQEFAESAAGKWLLENKGMRGGAWQTPVVELMATTLLESGVTNGPLAVTEFSDGGLRLPPLPPSVADLIAPGTLTGNAIGYLRQTPTANPATTVAEGAPKPEGTLTLAAVSDMLRKIAAWLPVSDEFLEDVPALGSFIDAQLRLWVRLQADHQLLNGDGIAPNLTGFLTVPGTGTLPQGTATALDALALAMAQVQTDSGFAADGFVLNATDWGKLRLVKDANGNYLGGNPFGPPTPPVLWSLPVVPTSKIAAGTALVGAFRGAAQLFTKGGITVAASNSHQDYFVKNLTAIRAEVRAALAVYRPSAFVKVTGLTTPAALGREGGSRVER